MTLQMWAAVVPQAQINVSSSWYSSWCCSTSKGLLGAVWGINNPQNSDSLSMAKEAPAAVDHADSGAMSGEPLSPVVRQM